MSLNTGHRLTIMKLSIELADSVRELADSTANPLKIRKILKRSRVYFTARK